MFRPARIVSIILVVVVAIIALLVMNTISHERATAFYAQALGNAGSREEVSIGKNIFIVTSGSVSRPDAAAVSSTQRREALAVSYAQETARRSPLLGIAGTDPVQLHTYVSALRDTMTLLAAQQSNIQDRESIALLYPVSFLDALATLEQARLDFLLGGTDLEETAYRTALDVAIAAGDTDSHTFQKALTRFTAGNTARFVGLSGTQTPALMDTAIETIIARMGQLRNSYDNRESCFEGTGSACGQPDLDLPAFVYAPSADSPHADVEASGALSIISEANQGPLTGRSEVVLPSSACLSSIPGPYHFFAIRPEVSSGLNPLIFLNELDFSAITASSTGPVLGYLRNTYGISYSRMNPMNFYTCPVLGTDLGMIRAVIATSQLASEYPDTPGAIALSGTGPLDLSSAVQYLRDNVSNTNATSTTNATERLNNDIAVMLMFNEKSAGLDNIVGQIADIVTRDIRIANNGVPFDVSARTMFLTHAAFASLFLTQNDSAGTTPVEVTAQDSYDTQIFLSQLVRYFPLESDIPRALIVQSVHAINLFEQNEK